jgi:LPS-assembly protein
MLYLFRRTLLLSLMPITASAYTDFTLPSPIPYSDGLFLDWAENNSQNQVCQGNYSLPVFDPFFPVDETYISADEVSLPQNGASILSGDVQINEKDRRLFADKVLLYRDTQGDVSSIRIPGFVVLEEPTFRLAGENATLVKNEQTTINQVQYRYYATHARGEAQRVVYVENAPTQLYQASYTTCSPDSNAWHLTGSTVTLNQETGRGEAYNTVLKVQDIPVFYSPYLNFPIDSRRQSGFLMPEFGSQTDSGFIVGTPYYFNLAPNYDATFYPRYLTERGLQLGGELRYLDEYHQTQLYGTYLNQDQAFAAFQNEQLEDPAYRNPNDPRLTGVTEVDDNRWDIAFTHLGVYDANWSTELDYNKVSDDNYFVDLGTDIFNRDERELLQRAQLNYSALNYSATALVQNYQILQPFENNLYEVPYQILPHLELNLMPERMYLDSDMAMNMQYTYFDHEEDPFDDELPTIGSRSHVNPVIQTPLRRTYGYLLPAVEYRYTQYDLALSPHDAALENNDQINRSLPTAYLDGGLFFDRETTWLNRHYTQTLEPRFFYLYTPYVNQEDIPLFDTSLYNFDTDQLFRTNRFNGLDRIADANQISGAISTQFYEHETGIKRFDASIGQILYFEDRKVFLCDVELDPGCDPSENLGNDSLTSPLVADLRYQFNYDWYSTMSGRYDPTPADTDLYRLLFHYEPESDLIVHFGFHYDQSGNNITGAEPGTSEAALLQTDTGVVWPVNPNWSLLGRWYYDIQNQFTVESFGGVEYESCCWGIRAGARRYLVGSNEVITDRQYDSQLFLQFVLKGLAGVGSSPVGLLVDSIPGYNDRFEAGAM